MCKLIKSLFLTLMLLMTLSFAKAESQYYTYLNNFEGFNKSFTNIDGTYLVLNNQSCRDMFNLIDINQKDCTFKCFVRFANRANKEGKTYKILNDKGKSEVIKNLEWGLVWNYKDSLNYYKIRVKCNNSFAHDAFDERTLLIDAVKILDGKEYVLSTHKLTKDIDLGDGFNVLSLVYDGTYTYIYIGNKELKQVAKIDNIDYINDYSKIGYYAGVASHLYLERFVIKSDIMPQVKLQTSWDKNSIDNYVVNSTTDHSLSGIWKYLDRDINNDKIKLGGKYQLAIIENANGYDIVYYDGAIVNNLNWKCGMLKGRLVKTQFNNTFDLEWYDSNMQLMSNETYAQAENNSIITFFFPIQKSQIRFMKIK